MSEQLLAQALRTLVTATDAQRAMHDLAGLLVPELADWCLIDLLQPPDLVTRVVALGVDGPLELPASMGDVAARRSSAQSVGLLARLVDAPGRRLRLDAAFVAAAAGSDDVRTRAQAQIALSLGTTEALVLGMVNVDELLGVVSLGRSGRGFTVAEAELLSDVAAAAGLALSGARLRELQRSISTALQRSLLPPLPVVAGVELAARFVPAESGLAVGGDWYDAFVLPGGVLALVVGDATGHDAQAAARMAELRNLLRAVAVDGHQPPAATLSRLDAVADHLTVDLSGTCVYARLDQRSRPTSCSAYVPTRRVPTTTVRCSPATCSSATPTAWSRRAAPRSTPSWRGCGGRSSRTPSCLRRRSPMRSWRSCRPATTTWPSSSCASPDPRTPDVEDRPCPL